MILYIKKEGSYCERVIGLQSQVLLCSLGYITDFLEEGNSGIKKEPKEVTVVAKSKVPWYVGYINYLIVDMLPLDPTYQ